MKSISLIATIAAGMVSGTAALAADVIDTPVSHNWSGVYLGIHAGGTWAKADDSAEHVNLNGGAVGAYAGANWQAGSWVFGIEGDVNYTSSVGTIYAIDVGTEWQSAFRGRLGYAIDNVLIYGAGGLAISEVSLDAPPILSAKETFTGWTLGGGVEYAFTQNWTTRLDYRYSDYGGSDFGVSGTSGMELTEHALRVGVGYKF